MTIIFGVGIYLFGRGFIIWANTKALENYIYLLPLGLLPVGVYEILSFWTIRTKEFSYLARTKIRQGIAMVTTQIGFGYTPFGNLGLVLGEIIGRCAGIWTLARPVWRENRAAIINVKFGDISKVIVRYRRFPLLSTPSVFLNRSATSLPPVLFAAFYGPKVAGLMVLCERVLRTPVSLLGQSTAKVYFGEAAELRRNSPEKLLPLFLLTLRRLFWVGIVPFCILIVFGPLLFKTIFGANWYDAGVYARIMGISLLLGFMISPLSHTLNILERQDLQLGWDTLYFTLQVGSLIIAHTLKLSALSAVIIYSGAIFISYFLQILLLLLVLKKYVAVPVSGK